MLSEEREKLEKEFAWVPFCSESWCWEAGWETQRWHHSPVALSGYFRWKAAEADIVGAHWLCHPPCLGCIYAAIKHGSGPDRPVWDSAQPGCSCTGKPVSCPCKEPSSVRMLRCRSHHWAEASSTDRVHTGLSSAPKQTFPRTHISPLENPGAGAASDNQNRVWK